MTTVRVGCSICGDVLITPKELVVRVCADNNEGNYAFRCPECKTRAVKSASPRIVELLVSYGVEMQVWRLPEELWEPKTGPRLTHDDLLDLHEQLQEDDWLEQLKHAGMNGEEDPFD